MFCVQGFPTTEHDWKCIHLCNEEFMHCSPALISLSIWLSMDCSCWHSLIMSCTDISCVSIQGLPSVEGCIWKLIVFHRHNKAVASLLQIELRHTSHVSWAIEVPVAGTSIAKRFSGFSFHWWWIILLIMVSNMTVVKDVCPLWSVVAKKAVTDVLSKCRCQL